MKMRLLTELWGELDTLGDRCTVTRAIAGCCPRGRRAQPGYILRLLQLLLLLQGISRTTLYDNTHSRTRILTTTNTTTPRREAGGRRGQEHRDESCCMVYCPRSSIRNGITLRAAIFPVLVRTYTHTAAVTRTPTHGFVSREKLAITDRVLREAHALK